MTGQKVKCKKATVVTKETKEQQQTGQVSMDIQEKIPKHRLERWPQRVCIQHSMLKILPLNHGYGAHTLPTVRAVHTCHIAQFVSAIVQKLLNLGRCISGKCIFLHCYSEYCSCIWD